MSIRFAKLSMLNQLRQCCHSLPPRLALKKSHLSPSANSAFSLNHLQNPTRSLSTSWPKWKDVPQPKDQETEKVDLDIWKSVMRSQVAQEETPRASDDDTVQAGASEMGQDSPREATRQLVEMWRQAGKQVPEHITDEELDMVAERLTKSSKKKYLRFLCTREAIKKANKRKQEQKRMKKLAEIEEMSKEEGDDEEVGSKCKNTFLLNFWTRSEDRLLGWKSAQAMQFGQPLVFDMSYEQHMTPREIANTASQLLETEGHNRRAVDPFHLHFCNLNPEGTYHEELVKRYGTNAWENLLITASPQRHVDMFPLEQLVYLTADSPNPLRTFDCNKVYIIGALVDRSNQPGVSLANAKRLNLATARLPLDEHLDWESGAKNLSLDQMFQILRTIKETGSWVEALKFVPKRKHAGFHSAKNGSTDLEGAEGLATKRANRESKNLLISKQHFRGGVEGKASFQSPLTNVLKRKTAAFSDRQKARKNWWED
ncbi:tRNA methyltransferase 10 homolog C [Sardina pilchardus]|uniref:tRNA methyltransferase 10 homolog C n=1 Tax=Sardina pilchardus TaxID=27697 RepID=UPI002E1042F0